MSAPDLPPEARYLLDPERLLHSRCGKPFAAHPYGSPNIGCPFPALPPVEFATTPAADRMRPATWVEEAAAVLWPGLPTALALGNHPGQMGRCAEALAAAYRAGWDDRG